MRKTAAFGFIVGLFVSAALLFTGCDNFLKGEDVKNEIVQAIDYNNAPYYTIKIETVGDSGVVRTHFSGTAVQKVTDTFTVKFEPKDDYKFISWEAVVGDLKSGESASDYIVFESPQSLETKITFKKASDKITIRPVCPKRLTYTFEQGTGEIFTRDTSLVLKFSEELSSECEPALENLTIQATDDDASPDTATYFATPKIYEDKIIFSSNTANGFISIPASGRRAITVKLAKEKVFYICNQYSTPVKVYLDSDIVQTCFIGPETSKKVNLKYSVRRQADETPLGTLKINGRELDTNDLDTEEFAYSVGTDLTIKYKLPENYTFKKWSFLGEDGNPVEADKLNIIATYEDNPAAFGYDAATNTAQVTLSIFNPMEQTVTVCPEILDPIKIVAVKGSDADATMRADDVLLTQDNTDFALGIGKSITFKYKFSDTHKFYGWKVTRQYTQDGQTKTEDVALTKAAMAAVNLDYAFDDSADANGLIAALYTAQITITVKNYIDGTIKVTPDVRPIPIVTIKLDGKHGKFTPAKDNYQVKEGSVNSIGFEADTDFGFVCWKVYNAQTGKEIKNQNYITFADYKKENTTYTLVNAPEDGTNLAVMPYVLECPNILSRWPEYDAEKGSRSDTTIEIVFDHDMDPDCILYTEGELETLPAGAIPRESSVHPGRYYGYLIENNPNTDDDDEVVLKNIQITDKRSSANVAKFYGEPTFEDPMTLFIPALTPEDPAAEPYLGAGITVIVSLDNDFHYKDKETKVPVYLGSSERKWRFIVNGERDNQPPAIDSTNHTPVFSISGCSAFNQAGIPELNISSNGSELSALAGHFITNSTTVNSSTVTLHLNDFFVTDDQSYPTTMFTMECKRVYDGKYTKITPLTSDDDYTRTIDYDFALGSKANYTGDYELKNLPDGVYSVRYKFKDRSGNTRYYPAQDTSGSTPVDKYFYFAVDTRAPELAAPISEVLSARTTTSVTVMVPDLSWGSGDVKTKILKYTKEGGSEQTKIIQSFGVGVVLENLEAGIKYTVKAEIEDYAGHKTESNGFVFTKPDAPVSLSTTTVTANGFTITWSAPSTNYDSYIIYYKKAEDINFNSVPIEKGSTSYSLNNLSFRTKYDIYIVSKANDVLSGRSTEIHEITKPRAVSPETINSKYNSENLYPYFEITVGKPPRTQYDTLELWVSADQSFPENATKKIDITNINTCTVDYIGSNRLTTNTLYYTKIVSSAVVSGTTVTNEGSVKRCNSWLSKMYNVQEKTTTNSTIELSWKNNFRAGDTGVKIYKKENGNSSVFKTVLMEELAPDENGNDIYEITGLIANTRYILGFSRYRLIDGNYVESEIYWPDSYYYTKPDQLTNIVVTEDGNNYVISWTVPETGYDYVRYFVKKNNTLIPRNEYNSEWGRNQGTDTTQFSIPKDELLQVVTGQFTFILDIFGIGANQSIRQEVSYILPVELKNYTGYVEVLGSSTTGNLSWATLNEDNYQLKLYSWLDDASCPTTPQSIPATVITDYEGTSSLPITLSTTAKRTHFKIAIADSDGNPYDGSGNWDNVTTGELIIPVKGVTNAKYQQSSTRVTVEFTVPANMGTYDGFLIEVNTRSDGKFTLEMDPSNSGNKTATITVPYSSSQVTQVYIYTVCKNDGLVGKFRVMCTPK